MLGAIHQPASDFSGWCVNKIACNGYEGSILVGAPAVYVQQILRYKQRSAEI